MAISTGVVVGRSATKVELYAAEELCRYLRTVYGISCRPTREVPRGAAYLFLVGSLRANPAGPQVFPELSEQGILLRNIRFGDAPALVVGGGSPQATLWAVYELVERFGVRYLLHEDLMPSDPAPFPPEFPDIVMEPVLPIRWWRTVNDFACGPESWGIGDHRPVIDQLAKLKFNRIFLSLWPYQPFVDLKFRGIERRWATLWFGYRYPITDDMPGRELFGEEEEFWNPDLPRDASYEELTEAAQRLAHGIIAHARSRGMSCGITASLLDFPREFAPLLKDARPVHQLERLTVVPGPGQDVSDPELAELAAAVVRTTLGTYPEVEFLLVGMPEFRQWTEQYERAWWELNERYGVDEVLPLEELLERARRRRGYPGDSERAVQEVKGDIVGLRFYDRIFREMRVLDDMSRPDVKLVYGAISEELFPILDRVLPPGSEVSAFVDYTPSRVLRRREALGYLPAGSVPASLVLTLHDDNVGVLPQLAAGSLSELMEELRTWGWKGFSMRYWLLGDHDLSVALISRMAWDPAITKEDVYRDYLSRLCGEAWPEIRDALEEVEKVTTALELGELGLGLTFPVPGMMAKHWKPGPFPEELDRDREGYRKALEILRGAAERVKPSGRRFTDYWMGRLEFGVGYLDAIELVRQAASLEEKAKKAKEQGDEDACRSLIGEAAEKARRALEAIHHALEAYARVVVDRSDLGAIAIMGEYVWRWLKRKVEEIGAAC